MISNNSSSLLILLYLLRLMIFCNADLTISNSCQSKCGGLNIPYPFGIGMDCYLEKWYEINCTTILGKDVPFLSLINKEVVNISLPSQIRGRYSPMSYGSVHIRNPITSKGCSSNDEKSGSFLNLTGSPFYIGYTNTLIGVGCNNNVSLTNVEPSMVGCMSSCVGTNHTLDQDYLMSSVDCNTKALMTSSSGRLCRDTISLTQTRSRNKTSCSGFGCCKASMPDGIQQIVGVEIHSNDTTTKECKVAFLTAGNYNGYTSQHLHDLEYSTVELGWFIRTTNHSFIDSLECKNIRDYNNENINMNDYTTRCVCDGDLSDVACACSQGYRGSPYLPFGCKDIDECLEQGDYQYCGERGKCVNLQGHYDCVYTNRRPLIIGISVGFGSLIFIVGIYFSYIFIRKQRRLNQKKNFFKRNGGLLLQQQLNSTKGSVEKIKVFNSRDLEKATENFSLNRILGQGGQGTVYKGMLVDGSIVAVKKSKVVDEDKLEEFINEVVILSQINHRNIVKLLGCCLETNVPLLVYEFVPNGNLFEHLYDELDDYTMTTWEVRLRIAVEIAGALSYLHSAASSPIYHRDVKSTNIMLDEKYRAKISDFGTSRSVTIDHTHLTTIVSGTMGYIDPEYFQSSQFTDKSDVYSFGIVLVELITGEKSISFLRSQENRNLSTYFILAVKENRLFEIIDARIKDGCKMEQVIGAAEIAKRCLNLKGKKRPTMREVSMELEMNRSSLGDMQMQPHVSYSKTNEKEKEDEYVEVNIG